MTRRAGSMVRMLAVAALVANAEGAARASLPPLPVAMPANAGVGAAGASPLDGGGEARWLDTEAGRVRGTSGLDGDAGQNGGDDGRAPAGPRYGAARGRASDPAATANALSPAGVPVSLPDDRIPPADADAESGGADSSTDDLPAAGDSPQAPRPADAGRVSPSPAGTAAAPPALEGPPVPLPVPLRLTNAPADMHDARDMRGKHDPRGHRRISLDLQQAPLAAAFDAFARFTGQSIVLSGRVQGSATLRVRDVPWRDAFDALLDANGLAMAQRGGVIWVAPVAELAARERARFETHARAAELEPLASRTFVLRYPRANDVARLLAGGGAGQRVLSRRGSVLADPRTNLLFVTDLDGRLAQIAALLAQLDRPSRQVLIEARIVEGERGFSRELGARLALRSTAWGGSAASGSGAGGAGGGGAGGAGGAATPEPTAGGTATGIVGGPGGRLLDLSARPLAGFEAATAGLTLFVAGASRLLDLELSALEAEGRGRIVSSPRIVTADRASALIEQGTELPYQAKVGLGVSGVQFRRATLKLEVEPQITPEGHVVLDLDVAKDSVGEATDAGPAIHTKHVRTRVEVENGGTVSIGGIYESDRRDDVTRVPVLGKIPVLGALFRHRARRERTAELVVYITPRVVGAPDGPPTGVPGSGDKSAAAR
ncbi:type IV pilus secretin PilQ [Burkholderia perseverans]|uniref:type IV pilus secretin PilQ n=1 Tax=Burkholderia perseverans TaxID=2615214 RepID=UPI001FEF6E46|nr:type IV pilus secretin PilQ [Burkholderia perseverans]